MSADKKHRRIGGVTFREDETFWLDQVLKALPRSKEYGVLVRHPAYTSIKRKVNRIRDDYSEAKA